MTLEYIFFNKLDLTNLKTTVLKMMTQGSEFEERLLNEECFSCKYFSILWDEELNIEGARVVAQEYYLDVNYEIDLEVFTKQENAILKTMQLLDELLKILEGDAILLSDTSLPLFERRGTKLVINKDFEEYGTLLTQPYLEGRFRRYYLKVENRISLPPLKEGLKEIAFFVLKEKSFCTNEDEFELLAVYSEDFQVELEKRSQYFTLYFTIFNEEKDRKIYSMIEFIRYVIEKYEGDCELTTDGNLSLYERKRQVLLERKGGKLTYSFSGEEEERIPIAQINISNERRDRERRGYWDKEG